jgi:hypothetical protein
MKKKTIHALNFRNLIYSALTVFGSASAAFSQMPTPVPRVVQEDNTWWYVTLFVLILGLCGAVGWWFSAKKSSGASAEQSQKKKNRSENDHAIDSYKELEWLRSNRQNVDRKRKTKKQFPENMPQPSRVLGDREAPGEANAERGDFKSLDDLQTMPLPIFGIQRLELARPFNALPISNDEALLSAIEQTQDEYEEDEEVRDLAVRILAAFKTRNSVEALSQVALYDLSSNLRSKAVSTLAEFNHESVFEIILLACADPTREVRAAAARGLSRLSFDRADAWLRIGETGEPGRRRQAARAAIEGGFVERIFDRLVHRDLKHAFEAVALLSMLVKADETAPIFQKLAAEKNSQMQRAILHVIKITNSENALNGLCMMLDKKDVSMELKNEIDATIESIGLVTV